MKKPQLKTLVYIQNFLGECMPIYPLYALMFAERSGLSNSEISLLFGGWVAIALLAEIPTGIIADKFSRKWALIYCYILQALAFGVWLLFPSFWGYGLGFFIWGIGYAFSSGAFEAYLYEELKAHGQVKSFSKVFARSQSLSLAGMVLAYVAASVLGAESYTPALVLSIVLSLATAAVITIFPYQSRGSRGEKSAESYVGTLKSAVKEVRRSKRAWAYVLALGVLGGLVGTMEEYTPLFYNQVGFSSAAVPVILAAGLLLSSLVGWFAHHMERLRYATVSLFVVAGALLLYAATFGQIAGLLGMMGFMRLIMLAQVLFGATLQHHIQDDRRATIGSLASFGGSLLALGLISTAGILFATVSNNDTYRILAVIFIALGALLVLQGRKKHLRVEAPDKDAAPAIPPGHPL